MNKTLYGNNSAMAENPASRPHFAPTLGLGGSDHLVEATPGSLDLTLVDDLAGSRVQGIGDINPSNPFTELARMRSYFPFLQIVPLGVDVAGVFLPTLGVADDLIFPEATTLAIFAPPSVSAFLAVTGNAAIPSAANTPSSASGGLKTNPVIFLPAQGNLPFVFYVGNKKSVSVVATGNNAYVSALCLIGERWKPPHVRG